MRWQKSARAVAICVCLAAVLTAGCAVHRPVSSAAPAVALAPEAAFQDTGSDTLVNLALAWAERYMSENPQVRISVTGGGSGTGIASLINGTVQIANASREMSTEEIAEAKKNGITPMRFTVALDAIAVVANHAGLTHDTTAPATPLPSTSMTLRCSADGFSSPAGSVAAAGQALRTTSTALAVSAATVPLAPSRVTKRQPAPVRFRMTSMYCPCTLIWNGTPARSPSMTTRPARGVPPG